MLNSMKKKALIRNSVSNWYMLLNYQNLLCNFIKLYKERDFFLIRAILWKGSMAEKASLKSMCIQNSIE